MVSQDKRETSTPIVTREICHGRRALDMSKEEPRAKRTCASHSNWQIPHLCSTVQVELLVWRIVEGNVRPASLNLSREYHFSTHHYRNIATAATSPGKSPYGPNCRSLVLSHSSFNVHARNIWNGYGGLLRRLECILCGLLSLILVRRRSNF